MGITRPLEIVGDAGWFVARYPHVHCTYVGPKVPDASFDALVQQLAQDIDDRGPSDRVGVLYYTPETSTMDSPRRRKVAKILNERKDKLAQTTAAYALATHSPFIRGVLNTLFWMAPPGYPYKIVNASGEGLDFIAQHTRFDAVAIARSFQALIDEQLRAAS